MDKAMGRSASQSLTIGPPDSNKRPLKENIYDFARTQNAALIPMFPYLEEGAIVPAATLMWGRANGDYGFFMHDNTVDEVVIIFGGDVTNGRGNTGLVRVSTGAHGVGRVLKNPDDPDAYVLISITQRQADDGREQKEGFWFLCEECKAELCRIDFGAYDQEPVESPRDAPFVTMYYGGKAYEEFNTENGGKCPECGHVNAHFPGDRWGWDAYLGQTRVVQKAREALVAVAEEARQAQRTE